MIHSLQIGSTTFVLLFILLFFPYKKIVLLLFYITFDR